MLRAEDPLARDDTTLRPDPTRAKGAGGDTVVLTLIAHPDPSRVGERALLPRSTSVELGRKAPDFAPVGQGGAPRPLDDPYISRKPAQLRAQPGGGLRIEPNLAGAELKADGEPILSIRTLGPEALGTGVVLEVAGRAALLAHRVQDLADSGDDFGMVGRSDALPAVRRRVGQVADLDVPVLIRGESGVGKELVARAIHGRSGRRDGPFRSVNMAAISPSVAASELFGHRRGAFTGADRPRNGLFREADGGTLFLDEIGEASPEVQAMLLRVLETGRVQPVGSDTGVAVNTRVLAATDLGLEDAVEHGRFRLPLLHRLSGFELIVPPLRERRDDIALLLLHFLRSELAAVGEAQRLDPTPSGGEPWLPIELVTRLCRADWPGNIRQLRNVARQLVIGSRGMERLELSPAVERALAPAGSQSAASPSPRASARPADITEDALLAALREHRYGTAATAKALGISKTSLYARIEASDRIRKARDLGAEEIAAALATSSDLRGAAQSLEVSERGLRLRMTELGIDSPPARPTGA